MLQLTSSAYTYLCKTRIDTNKNEIEIEFVWDRSETFLSLGPKYSRGLNWSSELKSYGLNSWLRIHTHLLTYSYFLLHAIFSLAIMLSYSSLLLLLLLRSYFCYCPCSYDRIMFTILTLNTLLIILYYQYSVTGYRYLTFGWIGPRLAK